MASNLTVDTLTKGATTLNTDELVDVNNTRVAKAWVNFNGTGTVAIRASYNVSSITDNGTGKYTVNFTTAMPDTNYTFSGAAGGTGGSNIVMYNQTPVAPTVSALAIMTANAYVSLNDMIYVSLAIFR
jgi:hypothetical protein